jgi:hypothetical protein
MLVPTMGTEVTHPRPGPPSMRSSSYREVLRSRERQSTQAAQASATWR